METSVWKAPQGSIIVETIEEATTSHRSDIGRVEASGGKARQSSLIIKHEEEAAASHGSDIGEVEASVRQAFQEAIIVEGGEEAISHRRDVADIETSLGEAGQVPTLRGEIEEEVVAYGGESRTELETASRERGEGSCSVEVGEKVVSYGGEMGGIEASGWEATEGPLRVEVLEEAISRIRRTRTDIGR